MSGNPKSLYSSYIPKDILGLLYTTLFSDVTAGRPINICASLNKDLQVLLNRMNNEGISIVTKLLPTLGKAVLSAFRSGIFICPKGLKVLRGTSYPRFLSGLMQDIFDVHGFLRIEADKASITEVLQICFMCYKLETPDSLDASNALLKWRDIEEELSSYTVPEADPVLELATDIVARVFSGFNHMDIKPCNGPGAVATGERRSSREKWIFKSRVPDLDRVYSPHIYWHANGGYGSYLNSKAVNNEIQNASLIDAVTKQVAVPKDSRGPRLISTEPLPVMWIQKGLQDALYKHLQCSPLTGGQINFDDQTLNQDLAVLGSLTDHLATLDMSDASDRVSKVLVEKLFSRCNEYHQDRLGFNNPSRLLDALLATRSSATKTLDGDIVVLHKFAPMGSAVCFPVEAVTFWSLAVAAISLECDKPWQSIAKRVYVYGDDLIIDSEYAHIVLRTFPRYKLIFNEEKCYVHGPFRESCGADAYLGTRITPIKWRKPWPGTKMSPSLLQSLVDTSTQFYAAGYWRVAQLGWTICEGSVGKLPTIPLQINVPFLCRRTRFQERHYPPPLRWDCSLQTHKHRSPTLALSLTKLGEMRLASRRARPDVTPLTGRERGTGIAVVVRETPGVRIRQNKPIPFRMNPARVNNACVLMGDDPPLWEWSSWARLRKLNCAGSAGDPDLHHSAGKIRMVWHAL